MDRTGTGNTALLRQARTAAEQWLRTQGLDDPSSIRESMLIDDELFIGHRFSSPWGNVLWRFADEHLTGTDLQNRTIQLALDAAQQAA